MGLQGLERFGARSVNSLELQANPPEPISVSTEPTLHKFLARALSQLSRLS